AVDAATVLANWHIPYAGLTPGWMPLRLPVALDQFHRALELRVRCIGTEVEPLRLSVAPVGLAAEFALGQVTDAADEAAVATPLDTMDEHMLAIRIWGGLPGIAYDPALHLAAYPLHSVLTYPLPEHIVANVRKTRECEARFPWFGYLPKGRILLHPLPEQVVSARIAVPARLPLVSATCDVTIEDGRCRTPIACKLVAAAASVSVDQAEKEEGILASSGWTTIESPLCPFQLTAPFGGTWNGPVHLHLFTRITDESPGHYGRTVFNRFHLELDARSAWSHPPYPGNPEP
ncbi:MAG TPA: DUF6212 domain-containing protein, partial [Bradyrhizobium sp.]|nr:DUF6212 domain-containing protein [Bradyrhizobium sp.]